MGQQPFSPIRVDDGSRGPIQARPGAVEVQDAEECGAEAEYYSASEMAIKIIYLRTLLANMQLRQSGYAPVFEDNTGCIEWANHVIGGRERAKHMDISKHFAHEAVQNGHLRLYKIAMEFQLADILTKAP